MKTIKLDTIHDWLLRLQSRTEKIAITFKNTQTKTWEHFSATQYLQKITSLKKNLTEQTINKSLKNKIVALICSTRWEWAAIDIATISSGALLVPLYPNLNDEDVTYILNHCEADILILESKKHLEQFYRIESNIKKN